VRAGNEVVERIKTKTKEWRKFSPVMAIIACCSNDTELQSNEIGTRDMSIDCLGSAAH
jgi:hypothetical protein